MIAKVSEIVSVRHEHADGEQHRLVCAFKDGRKFEITLPGEIEAWEANVVCNQIKAAIEKWPFYALPSPRPRFGRSKMVAL